MRLIDVECKELTETIGRIEFKTRKDILSWLDAAPTIDAKPIRYGHWVICSDGYYPYCSKCKQEPSGKNMTNYCPNCGAKMMDEVSE